MLDRKTEHVAHSMGEVYQERRPLSIKEGDGVFDLKKL